VCLAFCINTSKVQRPSTKQIDENTDKVPSLLPFLCAPCLRHGGSQDFATPF
jgi:hypothetical protein